MRTKLVLALAALALLGCGFARAEEKTENYESGKPKNKYTVDANGKKQGAYEEYFESGAVKIKSNYKDDLLDGKYSELFESGKEKIGCNYKAGQLDGKYSEKDEKGGTAISAEYADGKLDGEYKMTEEKIAFPEQILPDKKLFFIQGHIAYPKPQKYIEKQLADILAGKRPTAAADKKEKKEDKKSAAPTELHEQGRRLLNAYRFVCDLPYDVELDDELNKYAKAGAEICAAIGKLNHTPPNPGWDEARYQYAYYATSHSNLAMRSSVSGDALIPVSVDSWMDDSDDSNIDRVGHRRWCLNPGMSKVGFGASGNFCDQMAHDDSRTPMPEWDVLYYPPRGYCPARYFSGDYAWCVLTNPQKMQGLSKNDIKVAVYEMDKKFKKSKKPLEINYFNVETGGFGKNQAVIFRPSGVKLAAGSRYWVEIAGVKNGDGSARDIAYLVEFFGTGAPVNGRNNKKK